MSFGATLPEIQNWVSDYGIFFLFGLLVAENILFLGMIVPGLFVLVAAGYLAASGTLSIATVIGFGILGVAIGDSINFVIGRYFLGGLLSRSQKLRAGLRRMNYALDRDGNTVLVIYHFEPLTRMIGAAAAGACGLSMRRWFPFDLLGAILWVGLYGSLGYVIGITHRDLSSWNTVQPVQYLALAVIIGWLIFVQLRIRKAFAASPDEA